MSVVASAEVADEALQRTHYIVTHMLAGRPDVLQAMAKHGTRLIIIGKDQVYTDMPEYRNHPNPAFQNERVRGTGGLDVTSFGEENLLNLPARPLRRREHRRPRVLPHHRRRPAPDRPPLAQTPDADVPERRRQGAVEERLRRLQPGEYWAEICQSYFDCNRVNNWNHGPIGTRAA